MQALLASVLGALQRFLEGLLDSYSASVEHHSPARAVLLAAAAAELLQVHALLAEHAVALGYIDKLLKILQAHVPPREGPHGVSLIVCNCGSGGEAGSLSYPQLSVASGSDCQHS